MNDNHLTYIEKALATCESAYAKTGGLAPWPMAIGVALIYVLISIALSLAKIAQDRPKAGFVR